MERTERQKEILKKVKRIEIKTRKLSSNLFGGEFQSAFKGRGMSFSEVREYNYGDDIRFIDWNVTAKTGVPHVKVFEEERELTVMILVDVSPSTYFGTMQNFKSDIIAELAALISFSVIQNNDKVGLITFNQEVVKYISPGKGRSQVLSIIKEILDSPYDQGSTNIDSALRYMSNVIKRKCIVFLISDFFVADFTKSIRAIAGRHDVIGAQIIDQSEYSMPDLGILNIKDPETGAIRLYDTSSANNRTTLKEFFKNHRESTKSNFRKSGASYLEVPINNNYASSLHYFFKERMK